MAQQQTETTVSTKITSSTQVDEFKVIFETTATDFELRLNEASRENWLLISVHNPTALHWTAIMRRPGDMRKT